MPLAPVTVAVPGIVAVVRVVVAVVVVVVVRAHRRRLGATSWPD